LIGLGLLSLPYATRQIGWLPSFVGMLIVALMTVYGIYYAVMAKERFDKMQRDRQQVETAPLGGQVAEGVRQAVGSSKSLDIGLGVFDEVVYEAFGWFGQALYAFSINMCQIGTAICYITVIAESAETLFGLQSGQRVGLLIVIGATLMMLSAVKSLRGIAVLSLCGLLTYLFIFTALLWESSKKLADGTFAETVVMIEKKKPDYSMWFGVVAFAFGGFPIALAVYEDMQKPRHFFRVCGWSYALCAAFYMCFALLGYTCYGTATNEILYFNFTQGSFFFYGSLISISLVLLFTYVLQMVPVWNFLQTCVNDSVHYLLMRAATVIFTILVAYLVPSTAILVEVTGAFAAAIASLCLPPLVYLSMEPRPAWSEYPMAVSLVAFGCLGAMSVFVC